jgi:hypothetical protein
MVVDNGAGILILGRVLNVTDLVTVSTLGSFSDCGEEVCSVVSRCGLTCVGDFSSPESVLPLED